VVFKYFGPPPSGFAKYYAFDILDRNCSQFITPKMDPSILVPYLENIVPESDYNATSETLTAYLNVDTAFIAASPYFCTAGASRNLFMIDLCVQMNLYNERDIQTATEKTVVTFTVDKTQSFQIAGLQARGENDTFANTSAIFDFPLLSYFCDDDGSQIFPAAVFPGEVIQFCVRADTTEALVDNLKEVTFYNE
jgi:hypothetical protein